MFQLSLSLDVGIFSLNLQGMGRSGTEGLFPQDVHGSSDRKSVLSCCNAQ